MICSYCGGTGKYKKPNDEKEFEKLVDREMDKSYFVNYTMAEEKAYKEVGYTFVDCPYCKQSNNHF